MNADFNQVSEKIVKLPEYNNIYNQLKKKELTGLQQAFVSVTQPIAYHFDNQEVKNIDNSVNDTAAYIAYHEKHTINADEYFKSLKEPKEDVGFYIDSSGSQYASGKAVLAFANKIAKDHPIYSSMKPKGLDDKLEELRIKALKQCTNYADKKNNLDSFF